MSNIKKLLEGVEVEWKTLGEIAENVSSGVLQILGLKHFMGVIFHGYELKKLGMEIFGVLVLRLQNWD